MNSIRMSLFYITFFISLFSFSLKTNSQDFYNCVTACQKNNNKQEWCRDTCKHAHWSELQAAFKKPECHKLCADFGMSPEWCNNWSACGTQNTKASLVPSKVPSFTPQVARSVTPAPKVTTYETISQSKKIANKKLVAYYASWAMYGRKYPVTNIPADKVTHINYAFAKTDTQGNVTTIDPWADTDHRTNWNTEKPYWGNFRQLQDLKVKHPHLKTLISIGGWTLSDTFSDMAAQSNTRQNFIKSALKFARTYGFDGIDIDWEYPGFAEHNGKPYDKHNFTLLLAELRAAINQEALVNNHVSNQEKLLLTIAAPAGQWHLENIELEKIASYLDWINIMTYDFHGPWKGEQDQVTNHNSALFPTSVGDKTLNIQSTVNYYTSKNIPKDKLVVGLALYGRSYGGVQSRPTHDGLFSNYSDIGSGTTEKGVRLLGDIKTNLLRSGYTRYWDNTAKVPYLYNPTTREFVSYDDEESLGLKAAFIKNSNLGGAMVWELDTGTESALDAINKNF